MQMKTNIWKDEHQDSLKKRPKSEMAILRSLQTLLESNKTVDSIKAIQLPDTTINMTATL